MKKFALLVIFLVRSLYASPHGGGMGQAAGTPPSVYLTWTASITPGTTVNVYRCLGPSCTNFTQIATGVAAGGPYTDTTVTSGSYTYYVTAELNGVESDPSNLITLLVLLRSSGNFSGQVF